MRSEKLLRFPQHDKNSRAAPFRGSPAVFSCLRAGVEHDLLSGVLRLDQPLGIKAAACRHDLLGAVSVHREFHEIVAQGLHLLSFVSLLMILV